jgi:hypothetical protein
MPFIGSKVSVKISKEKEEIIMKINRGYLQYL